MDGNRRWAKKQGLAVFLGHKEGVKAVQVAADFCLSNNVKHLSLYAFSIENFKRSKIELDYLFNLITQELKNYLDKFIEKKIKISFIGDKNLFPEQVKPEIELVENKTKNLSSLSLNFLFCYGGQQEILSSVNTSINKLLKNKNINNLDNLNITKEDLVNNLWLKNTPDPDLIFRTGGQKRLSNYLLFQSAYSELYFSDVLWPEIKDQDFKLALDDFNSRNRRFGGN